MNLKMKNSISIGCALLMVALSGCSGLQEAREIKSAPMPAKYVEAKQKEFASPEGSLWKDGASLFEDRRARRVNDLVTILISEQTTASKSATTTANKESDADFSIAQLPTGLRANNLPILNDVTQGIKGNSSSDFTGQGDTRRQGRMTATVTAKVVEVLPNSNLVLEARKEIVVNNEKEIVVFRGIARPDDISTSNTISSSKVGDTQIYLVGDGVLNDKQSQGWLVRFFDQVWPF